MLWKRILALVFMVSLLPVCHRPMGGQPLSSTDHWICSASMQTVDRVGKGTAERLGDYDQTYCKRWRRE